MIDQRQGVLHRLGARRVILDIAFDEHNRQAEDSRGDDLAVGRLATGILGNDGIDAVRLEQFDLGVDREGAACEDIRDAGRRERRIDRIDAAHEIMVLRRGVEGLGFLPADREENATRRFAERLDGLGNGAHARPAVSVDLIPAEPFEPQQGHAGGFACGSRIGGHLPGEGVRRVDNEVDALRFEIAGKSIHPAEAAAADRYRLRCRVERAAGERQRYDKISARGEPCGEVARFGRAAQKKDAFRVQAG
jgi:hypothetical protein